MVGADLPTFKAWVGGYGNPVLLILLTVALYHHAQLGLSVIIEDYVHNVAANLIALIMVKLGGMRIPSVPPAASEPQEIAAS